MYLHEIPAYMALKKWANGGLKFVPGTPEDAQATDMINELVKKKTEELFKKYEADILAGQPVVLDGNLERINNDDFFNDGKVEG